MRWHTRWDWHAILNSAFYCTHKCLKYRHCRRHYSSHSCVFTFSYCFRSFVSTFVVVVFSLLQNVMNAFYFQHKCICIFYIKTTQHLHQIQLYTEQWIGLSISRARWVNNRDWCVTHLERVMRCNSTINKTNHSQEHCIALRRRAISYVLEWRANVFTCVLRLLCICCLFFIRFSIHSHFYVGARMCVWIIQCDSIEFMHRKQIIVPCRICLRWFNGNFKYFHFFRCFVNFKRGKNTAPAFWRTFFIIFSTKLLVNERNLWKQTIPIPTYTRTDFLSNRLKKSVIIPANQQHKWQWAKLKFPFERNHKRKVRHLIVYWF